MRWRAAHWPALHVQHLSWQRNTAACSGPANLYNKRSRESPHDQGLYWYACPCTDTSNREEIAQSEFNWVSKFSIKGLSVKREIV